MNHHAEGTAPQVSFTLHHATVQPDRRDTLLRLIDLGFGFRHADTFTGWSRTVLVRDYVAQMIRVSEPYQQFVEGRDGPVFSVLGYLSVRGEAVVPITEPLQTPYLDQVAWLLSHYLRPQAELRHLPAANGAGAGGYRIAGVGEVEPLP